MEQIRVIKEMRDADKRSGRTNQFIRPRYMVWENVPGAFSSNKGEDFRVVLEETARIVDKDAVIPGPPKGKWTPAGCIVADGWSISWRVHDAQFWGVPQRRKRISLVADFGGHTAPEILFERKGLSGNIEQSKQTGKETAGNVGESTSYTIKIRGGKEVDSNGRKAGKGALVQTELSGTLGVAQDQTLITAENPVLLQRRFSTVNTFTDGIAPTLEVGAGEGGNNMPMVLENHPQDSRVLIKEDGIFQTLDARMGMGGGNTPMVMENREPILLESNQNHATIQTDGVSTTLPASMGMGGGYVPMIADTYQKTTGSLMASGYDKLGTQEATNDMYVVQGQSWDGGVVRRLTPMECERLQNFPDGWTDIGDWVDSKGKTHKGDADSPRYKALGNSIALPFWEWMLKRMMKYLPENPTMASLFSGIGGFELCSLRAGITPLWNSEIESFPEAVTRVHFGDDDLGLEGDYERYL